jgi:cell division protein FtsB
MKALLAGLVIVLLVLQWRLWAGPGGVSELREVEAQLAAQQAENEALRQRNEMLENEVLDLKNGLEAIEERARSDLGMTREDEIFYRVIE